MTQKINIIAEIAQGFEGNKKLADLLLNGSINSGADIVKFQLIYAHELCIKEYKYFEELAYNQSSLSKLDPVVG